MAKKRLNQKYFYGAISESEKIGPQGSFAFGKRMNIYDDPSKFKILPTATKVSGAIVTDLVKWIVSGVPYETNKYFYSEGGKIYQETSGGTWSLLKTVTNTNGQGLEIQNDYLYYIQNTKIGRYGPLSTGPSWDDSWQTGLNDTSTTKFAPIKAFGAGFAVGHGNNVGWWDGSTWTGTKLTLPPGLNVRSIEIIDEFIAIGTWRGTAINTSEEGFLFFWDGVSDTYNFFTSIPEGACNTLVNSKNRLMSIVGSSGSLLMGYRPFEKIQEIPKMTIGEYLEVYPGAITNWRNKTHIGISGTTDTANLIQGVYIWGSKSQKYPEGLNYGYTISTGTETGTGVKIGALKGIGSNLYVGWKDGASYGVDKITNSGNPAGTAIYDGLIFDDGQLYSDKIAYKLKAYHTPLLTGESVQLSYKINRASSWTNGTNNTVVGTTETVFSLNQARFREIQIRCTLTQTNNTTPDVFYIGMEYDDLKEEDRY